MKRAGWDVLNFLNGLNDLNDARHFVQTVQAV